MIQPEELVGGEWAEWYRLTPVERWQESTKLWQTYLALGGSLDPEPDTQSPFFDARAQNRPEPPVVKLRKKRARRKNRARPRRAGTARTRKRPRVLDAAKCGS